MSCQVVRLERACVMLVHAHLGMWINTNARDWLMIIARHTTNCSPMPVMVPAAPAGPALSCAFLIIQPQPLA